MTKSFIRLLGFFSLWIVCVYAADEGDIIMDETVLRARVMREASVADDAIPGMTHHVKEAIKNLRDLANEKDLQRAMVGRFSSFDTNDVESADFASTRALAEVSKHTGGTSDTTDNFEQERSAAELLVLDIFGEIFNTLQRKEAECVAIIRAAIALEYRAQLLNNHPELDPAAVALILSEE